MSEPFLYRETVAVCKGRSFIPVVPMGKVSRRRRLSVSNHLLFLPTLWVFPIYPRGCQDPYPCLLSPYFALPIILALTVAETHCKGEPKSHNISSVVAAATESHYSSLTVSKRTQEQGCGRSLSSATRCSQEIASYFSAQEVTRW